MDNKKKVRNLLLYLGIPILIIIITAAVLSTNKSTSPKTSELEQYFVQDMVDSFNIDYGSGQIEITLKEGMSPIKSTDSDSQSATTATQPATEQQETRSNSKKSKIVVKGQLADIQRFLDDIKPYYNPASTDEIPHNLTRATDNSILMEMIPTLIIMIILIVAWVLIMKKMGGGGLGGKEMSFGKAKIKNTNDEKRKTTFDDVAGADEEKEELAEVVEFLKAPEKYNKLGARIPKGVLLVGPPGTGKTLLARAVAGEAGVPFFSISGSDFVEMFVGVGASRVRDLFDQAKKNSPCIIFIDEIDAIGRSRDSRMGGNDEREQTLNQLLSEMDGFDSTKGLLVLGATNRPEILDPALLRPGRFDRRVVVDKPDLNGRISILKVHSKDVLLDETVDFKEIALATSGAVGADLANMMNEAAINAVKNGRNAVSQKDLFEAVEVVLVGKEKKDRIMSKEERRIVSYHEVGHALVSALQKHSEPVQKITIVPRTMGALGYVMNVPEEEKYLSTKKELEARLVELMGGRAAEEIVFETVTTGAANDIQQATNLARAMVTQYGMSEKFGLMGLESQENQYLTGRTVLNCGDATAADIDQEVMKILKNAYDEAIRLLSDDREAMDKIAAFLIEKETITGKEFMKIFREVKGLPEPEEKKEDGEGIPDTEHLEKEDAAESPETAVAEEKENEAGAENIVADASEEKPDQSGEDQQV